MNRLHLACSLTWLFCINGLAYGGVWDEHCSEGSQCATMLRNYANLVKGDECTSFYTTGKCSRICTFSLKSLINRNSWSKCSQRCDWSSAIVDGAKSWLAMCLANPAPDVFDSEEDSKTTADHDADNDSSRKLPGSPADSKAKKAVGLRSLVVLCLMVSAIVTGTALSVRPVLRDKARKLLFIVRGRLRHLTENWYKRTTAGRGPLDVGSDMKELRILQRGARRHIKSLTSTLD